MAGARAFDRELVAGVFAIACTWAACWVLVTLRYSEFAGAYPGSVHFVIAASVGQAAAVLACSLFFSAFVAKACRVGVAVALAAVSASSFAFAILSGFQPNLLSVCCGVAYGAVLGATWANAALFLSSRDVGEVARCLCIGSLVGGVLLVSCQLFVSQAGAVFASALVPASLALHCWSCAERAGDVGSGAKRPMSAGVGERAEGAGFSGCSVVSRVLREYVNLYLTIFVFGLVFGLQIARGLQDVELPSVVVGASFLAPGIVLIVLHYGLKRSVNLRTLCLAILLCSVAALLPWLSGGGLSAILRTVVIFVAFTLFDLSSMATLVEVGKGDAVSRAVPVVVGRFVVMMAVTAGIVASLLVDGNAATASVANSVAILALVAVFSRFSIMREMLSARAEGLSSPTDRAVDALAQRFHLTNREREVLALSAKGYNVKRIAEDLTLSTNTVKTHQSHVYSKLEVHTRQELIRLVEQQVEQKEE